MVWKPVASESASCFLYWSESQFFNPPPVPARVFPLRPLFSSSFLSSSSSPFPLSLLHFSSFIFFEFLFFAFFLLVFIIFPLLARWFMPRAQSWAGIYLFFTPNEFLDLPRSISRFLSFFYDPFVLCFFLPSQVLPDPFKLSLANTISTEPFLGPCSASAFLSLLLFLLLVFCSFLWIFPSLSFPWRPLFFWSFITISFNLFHFHYHHGHCHFVTVLYYYKFFSLYDCYYSLSSNV